MNSNTISMHRAACAMIAAATMILAGCASAPTPTMGGVADANPPRLVLTDLKDPHTGKILFDWDRPGAFGAVGGDLKAVGDGACMAARVDLEALGYHPQAINEKGSQIPGGGFYCYPRPNGEKPDRLPPRLVSVKGTDATAPTQLAWDRPGAFGKIPVELRARGEVACMMADIKLEAIAYHPQAQGADGTPLQGGGFFCFGKQRGDLPGELAPRLVRESGGMAWDLPSAFGKVPTELQKQGNAVCGAGQKAIGYHPQAIGEQGNPIPGGGYFCVAARTTAGPVRRA